MCVCEREREGESHSVVFNSSATSWTVACQAPLSTGFSRQEYWYGLPFPSPGDLPNPGIEPKCPTLQADSLPSEPPEKPNQRPTFHLSGTHCVLGVMLGIGWPNLMEKPK